MKHALIIATSGRALAQSAVNAGWRCSVLDCFADRDTQVLAERTLALPDASELALDSRRLVDSALRFAPPHSVDALVCGSGFEHCPELLQELGHHYKPYGNSADTVRRLKDPRQLSALFAQIGVAHPDIAFRMPADPAAWLVKRAAAAGGLHVQWADEASDCTARDDRYFQRFVAGRACSVLFLADGTRSRILGFNEMLSGGCTGFPFAYRGAIAGVSIEPGMERQIAAALDRLVAETGLCGLNGMDFIITDGGYSALEINPRPTATLDLFDTPQQRHLFQAHVDACEGILPDGARTDATVMRGHAIVYARDPLALDTDWQVPKWCADLPVATSIAAGAPLCTIHAAADSTARVAALLHEREIALRAQLSQFSNSNSMKVAA